MTLPPPSIESAGEPTDPAGTETKETRASATAVLSVSETSMGQAAAEILARAKAHLLFVPEYGGQRS
jgi:hypothetical protein